MINRSMITAEVIKILPPPDDTFGAPERDRVIADIKICITQRSIGSYNNGIDAVKYDLVGLTAYPEIEKGMYIKYGGKKNRVNYVQKTRRYYQIFMEAAE